MVLEKTLESPLDCKEIQPVHPKVNRSSVFIGRTDVKAETPVFWPPDAKSWLFWKDPNVGKDRRQEEKGMREDEMVSWLTRWTWVWVNSGSWWWTERPGMLQFMGLERVGHDWATELNWTELNRGIWFRGLMFLIQLVCDKQNWLIWLNIIIKMLLRLLSSSKKVGSIC